jgi:predicted hydrolase (HD superfamily)
MIPEEQQAKQLLVKYRVPQEKQKHLFLVAAVSKFLAERILKHTSGQSIHIPLVVAAAYLHDIDKGVTKLPGEQHPDASMRVLSEEGMEEVASLVKNHPLHCILDPLTAPKTWEEKILFLSDKMVKYEIITVDKRFDLWRQEQMSEKGRLQLEAAYPKVKELEKEIFAAAGITHPDLTEFARTVYT